MTRELRIRLLGGFQVVHGDSPVTELSAPRQQSLLTYLLLHREGPQPRQLIASHLWPESSDQQARTNLRRELHHLRRNLPESEGFLRIERRSVAWRRDAPVDLDVAAFEDEITRAEKARGEGALAQVRHALRNALALYKGPLVPVVYEEWLLPHREALELQFVQVLERIFEIARSEGDYTAAVHYAERLIKQDPLGESWHRRLIELHAAHGNRAEALRIYNLCAETLRHELDVKPSPKTQRLFQRLIAQERTKVRSHNFPPETTPFIGRRQELREVMESLLDADCRCLTLVGPGGIGKTRLAIQAALRAQAENLPVFEYGMYFVPLVTVESPQQMIVVISDALGLPPQPGEDARGQLSHFLAEKSLLLLLDNFEHLHAGRGLIVQLGREAPQVKLLVTSRVRLNLKHEWVYGVRGLGFGARRGGERLADRSAVQLFHASASRNHVELTHLEDNDAAVQRICELLEGNPLAIELAASWAGTLTPEEIVAEIEHRLDFLTASQIDVPDRHRSMRTVFDQSWQMLTKDERALLRKLSLFPGRFDRPAAREIAGGTLRVLSSLVDKSMLRWRPDGSYDMHRLLRQFAADKLSAYPKERDRLAGRFSRYYLDDLQALEVKLEGAEVMEAIRDVRPVFGHIRMAWGMAVRRKDFQKLSAAAWSMYLFLDLRGRFEEGVELFALAGEALKSQGIDPDAADAERRLAYWNLRMHQASMNYRLGRYEQAQKILAESRRGLEEMNREVERARVLLRLGQLAFRSGQYEAARAHLEESLEVLRSAPHRWETATALSFLGDVKRSLGEYDQARALLLEALGMRREIGNPALVADSLNTLAILICDMGDYERGLSMFQESLALRRSLEDPWGVAKVLNNLGVLRQLMGEYDRAREHHEESLALRREIGNPFGVAMALHNLGVVAKNSGQLLEAETRFHEALLIRRRIDSKHGVASTLNMLGLVALAARDEAGARRYFKEALQIAMEIQAVPIALSIADGIAALLIWWGQYRFAAEVLSFVLGHPAADTNTLQEAKDRLGQLEGPLDAEGEALSVSENAVEDFDALMDRLLAVL